MHEIAYKYPADRNRLEYVSSEGLPSGGYKYDASCNLIHDEGHNMEVAWNHRGKVQTIKNSEAILNFSYSPLGHRQIKHHDKKKQYYLYDAVGHVLCIYETFPDMPGLLGVMEQPIYGSSRLGVHRPGLYLRNEEEFVPEYYTRTMGRREFELTDHLGNVNVTVSDRKVEVDDVLYKPLVTSYTDYYPFGYPMPERSDAFSDYRYGFNGQEKDNEVYGKGGSYTAEFWQYDSRLGRRWNVDPEIKPWQSSYATFSNNPILMIDPFGDDDIFTIKGEFIKRTNTVTNNILIMGENGKTTLLSQTKLDQTALRNVGKHYAAQISDIAKNVNIWGQRGYNSTMFVQMYGSNNNEYLGLFITQAGPLSTKPGYTSSAIDNYNDFQNALVHEWWHYSKQYAQDKDGTWYRLEPLDENVRELDAYIYQITHKTWRNTSRDHQMRIISNIGKYLYGIKDEDLRNEKMQYFENLLQIKFTNLSNKAEKVGWKLNLNNEKDKIKD